MGSSARLRYRNQILPCQHFTCSVSSSVVQNTKLQTLCMLFGYLKSSETLKAEDLPAASLFPHFKWLQQQATGFSGTMALNMMCSPFSRTGSKAVTWAKRF